MNVSLEILGKLSEYRSGDLPLQSLRDWEVDLFLRSRDLEIDDQKFLHEFEAHYAELSDSLISEQQFKSLLGTLTATNPAQAWLVTAAAASSASRSAGTEDLSTTTPPNMAELLPA